MRSHIIMAALLVAPGATLLAQDTSSTQMPQRDTIRGYNTPQSRGGHDSLQGDNALVMKIHRINQMEIKAGQLAQRNGSSAKVKQYGQQLVRDHQAADQKLTTLARSLGVTLKNDDSTAAGRYGQQGQYGQGRDTSFNQNRGQRDTTFGQGRSRDTTYRGGDSTSMGRYGQRGDSSMQGQGYGHEQEMKDHQQMQQQMQRLGTLNGTQFDAEFANLMAQGHDKAIKMLQQAQSNVQNSQLRTFITSTLPTLRTHLQVAQSLGGSSTATSTTSSQ